METIATLSGYLITQGGHFCFHGGCLPDSILLQYLVCCMSDLQLTRDPYTKPSYWSLERDLACSYISNSTMRYTDLIELIAKPEFRK